MPFERTASTSDSIKLLKQRLSGFETVKGRLNGLRFKPRSSDVFIVTPPKCGTTWMQQIVHQLRTGGDMEFTDITEVVPWIELAHDLHLDLEVEQRKNPRCYKTHCFYDHCPKGGKYIVIYREPCAAAYSFYNFFKGWFFQPGEVALDDFVEQFFLARGKPKSEMENASYFEHLVSWWKYRNDPNVLFLFFEEMKEDLESVVTTVASFLGISDQEKIRKAVQMSSFEFMRANNHKFNANLCTLYRNKACGLPEGATCTIVSTGSVNKALEVLSGKSKDAIKKKWEEVVTNVTGYKTYDQLRISFRKDNPLA